jgi:phenylalanyl-tRNA synthetase alpha subunit
LNREISSYIDQLKQSKVQLKQANIREVSQTNTLKQHKKRKILRQKERLRFARRFEKLSEEVKAEVTLLFRNLSLLETTPPTTDDSE